jgi:hypothetical protein
MASLTINFQANTIGQHFVGWRTYNDVALPFYNVAVVNVVGPIPVAVDVQIEIAGNLYCAYDGIEYTGYIIAACELTDPQTLEDTGIPNPVDDLNGDGIPNAAFTWTETALEQADPCTKVNILCESVPISAITIGDDGTSICDDGVYNLVFTEVTPGDQIILATGTATAVGGIVVSTNVTNAGQYKVAPVITATIPNCNSVPTFTAVLVPRCTLLDLSSYDCASQNDLTETPVYTISHGDSVVTCADLASLAALPSEWFVTDMGNCHCENCASTTIDASLSSSGIGKISYQTCWDGTNLLGDITLVTQKIDFGSITQLGCIIPDTIIIDQGTLDIDFTITSVSC